MTTTPIAPDDTGHAGAGDRVEVGPERRGRIGWIVAGSLATGLLAALLLAIAPFIAEQENDVTGAALCGFAIGWAMLAGSRCGSPTSHSGGPWYRQSSWVSPDLSSSCSAPVNGLRWIWPPALLVLVVWMCVQAHRQLRSRARRWLLYPVLTVMALACVGAGFETVREHLDENAYADERPAHRRRRTPGCTCSCTGSGGPTVVLQPGAGDISSAMGWIAPAVAAHTRVCIYDRAGRGWSDPADAPRTAHRSRPTCTRCCIADTCQGRTCWRGTPSAACTYASYAPATPTRSPGWC